jgi:hypothetical protein
LKNAIQWPSQSLVQAIRLKPPHTWPK